METRQQHLVRLCRFMEILLLVSITLTLCLSAFFLLWPFNIQSSAVEVIDSGWLMQDNILVIYENLAVLMVLIQIYYLFRGIKHGKLFTQAMINSARNIGLTLIATWIIGLLLKFFLDFFSFLNDDNFTIALSLEVNGVMQLILGVGLLILSLILARAKEMKDEFDLVI